MIAINKRLSLSIPEPHYPNSITAFLEPPFYTWANVKLDNSVITMNLDGIDFTEIWKGNEDRFAKLFFLSAHSIGIRLYLDTIIAGKVEEGIRHIRNTIELENFTFLHVFKMRFETTTQKLQTKNIVEERDDRILEALRQLNRRKK